MKLFPLKLLALPLIASTTLVLWIPTLELTPGSTPQAKAASGKLRIGVILPLSGKVAEYGTAMRNGIELLRKDAPQADSFLHFLYEDVQYDPRQAVSAFKKLRAQDNVDLVYSFGVDLSKAIAPLAERAQQPLLAQSVDPSISRDAEYIIRFSNDTWQYARALLDYIRENELKRIAVVEVQNAYISETLLALESLADKEMLTVVDSFELRDSDFRSTIAKIQAADYDAIAVFLGSGQIHRFFKQAKEQRVALPMLGTNWFESTSEIRHSEGAMNGAVFANNVVRPEFYKRYIRHFHSDSQITFAAYAYEFAAMMLDIARENQILKQRPEPGELLRLIRSQETRQGYAIGPVQYAHTSEAGSAFHFPLRVKQIRDNKIELIDRKTQNAVHPVEAPHRMSFQHSPEAAFAAPDSMTASSLKADVQHSQQD